MWRKKDKKSTLRPDFMKNMAAVDQHKDVTHKLWLAAAHFIQRNPQRCAEEKMDAAPWRTPLINLLTESTGPVSFTRMLCSFVHLQNGSFAKPADFKLAIDHAAYTYNVLRDAEQTFPASSIDAVGTLLRFGEYFADGELATTVGQLREAMAKLDE